LWLCTLLEIGADVGFEENYTIRCIFLWKKDGMIKIICSFAASIKIINNPKTTKQ
jgi:hypothetical protein